MLANTTLDWACEKDSIYLNEAEILSARLNGTFLDSNAKVPTKYTPPSIDYKAIT